MDRPSRRIAVDHFESLQIVGFVFRVENLLLVIPFIIFWSFLLINYMAVSGTAGLFVIVRSVMGIFLSLALFFCYLLVVLDYTSRGHQKPPKISGDLIDKNKGKFFKGILSLSFFMSAAATLGGSEWLSWFAAISLFILPMVLSIIAIQESFSRAMNPLNWFLFVAALSWDKQLAKYLVCYGLLILSLEWTFTQQDFARVIPAVTVSTMLLVALFRSIGVLVHANAESLGLPIQFSHEIEQQQIAENLRRDESDFSADLYRLVQADKINEAWSEFQNHLKQTDELALARFWPVISKWPNPALALLAGQVYIEQLVKQQNYQTAWQVLAVCFDRNGNEFKLLNAKSTLALTATAETNQQKKLAVELLRFFAKDFPNHPDSPAAMLNAVELMLGEDPTSASAKKMLRDLRIKYPQLAKQTKFQQLKSLADL